MMRDLGLATKAADLKKRLLDPATMAEAITKGTRHAVRLARAVSRVEKILAHASEEIPDTRPNLVLRLIRQRCQDPDVHGIAYIELRDLTPEDFDAEPWKVYKEHFGTGGSVKFRLQRTVTLKASVLEEINRTGSRTHYTKSLGETYDRPDNEDCYWPRRREGEPFNGKYVQTRGRKDFSPLRYRKPDTLKAAEELAVADLRAESEHLCAKALPDLCERLNRIAHSFEESVNKEYIEWLVDKATSSTDIYKGDGDNGLDTLLSADPHGKELYARLLECRRNLALYTEGVKKILIHGMIQDWEDENENKDVPPAAKEAVLKRLREHPEDCLCGGRKRIFHDGSPNF